MRTTNQFISTPTKDLPFFQNLIIIAAIFLLLLAALGCQNTTGGPAPEGQPVEISSDFASQTNDFAFEVFKNVSRQEKPEKNVFISPLSLHMALGMLLNGANGKTADEIKKTLRLNGISLTDANQTYLKLMEGLPQADPKVTLGLANSVWNRNDFQVESDFSNILKTSFKAEAQSFSSDADKVRINQWASDKTNGKIKKVIDQIDPSMVLFLMNALYFKGDWKYTFDTQRTNDYPFKLANGQQKTVKMMQMDADLRAVSREKYAAFELPYSNGRYTMTVLLPSVTSSVDALVNGFTAADWVQLQKDMAVQNKVKVGLPRFTLEYEIMLNNVLKQMGMPTAFARGVADFTKINKGGNLNVSFVKQNTFVAVDERGTEAAAVTTIGVELTSISINPYFCDRPFAVVISEKSSNTILFMGKMMNP